MGSHGVNLFRNTHSNTVSLFAKQGPAKIQDKGLWDSMELLLIDVAQVYMNLLWFENLLLMRLWVWNAYLVLLWNRALAYPRALLPSGGPLSHEFWQLTTPLRVIHITSYSILNIHQVFMLIEISKIQFNGTQEVKSCNKPCGHEPYWRLCYY